MKDVFTVMERWSTTTDLLDDYYEQADAIAVTLSYQKAKEVVQKRKEELIRLAHLCPSYSEETTIQKSEFYRGVSMVSSEIMFVGLSGHVFDDAGIKVYSNGIDRFEYYIKKIEVES